MQIKTLIGELDADQVSGYQCQDKNYEVQQIEILHRTSPGPDHAD